MDGIYMDGIYIKQDVEQMLQIFKRAIFFISAEFVTYKLKLHWITFFTIQPNTNNWPHYLAE